MQTPRPRLAACLAIAAAAIAVPGMAQDFGVDDPGREQAQTFTMPVLGPAGKATVLSRNRHVIEVLASAEYRALMPGCSQAEPGVFMCKSILEYQHCRTLMIARLVYSCQAGLAFEGGFAEPRAASPADYELMVDSNASIRVTLGARGVGKIRGGAEIELALAPPAGGEGAWCLQRDSYVYYPTGPKGGMSDFGEPAECDEPIELGFEPHRDDLFRAYDLCESFAAWGMEIEDTIEILVAGVFQIRSAHPEFVARHANGSAVIAPYLRVEAPLRIDCRV